MTGVQTICQQAGDTWLDHVTREITLCTYNIPDEDESDQTPSLGGGHNTPDWVLCKYLGSMLQVC